MLSDRARTGCAPALPSPAGPLSTLVVETLAHPPGSGPELKTALAAWSGGGEALRDDDLQLSLYMLYELHYRGFCGVADEWEWEPALLELRGALERVFLGALGDLVGPPGETEPGELDLQLRCAVDAQEGPSLSRFVEAQATLEQFREFVIHRSAYQLKEADPHSWAIPRLSGSPKAALLEVQFDEYGEGERELMHAELFATTMSSLGLDAAYGAYLSRLPGVTLATVNLMSLFGLHRRWRGAIVGHLAAFEMSSSLPNRRYSNGLQRLGGDARARRFYDVHVVADAVHENIAAVDLAGGLAFQYPELAGDVLFGARCAVALDGAFAEHVLARWKQEDSSLRAPAGELA
jgi:heme oxygenase-like protein